MKPWPAPTCVNLVLLDNPVIWLLFGYDLPETQEEARQKALSPLLVHVDVRRAVQRWLREALPQVQEGPGQMICEVWCDPRDNSITVFPAEASAASPEDYIAHRSLVSKRAKLWRIIVGASWTAIMTRHYQLMGWQPYKSEDEDRCGACKERWTGCICDY